MVDEKLLKFLTEQISLEKEIIDISKESVEDIKNHLVRELIRGITLDSQKHALLLGALKTMLSEPTPLIEESHFDEIKSTIEKHIALEAKAIDSYREILNTYEDNRIRTVISEIHKDEIRHHAFLKELLDAIVRKETLTSDELEDWMFKYAPFHGSPGG
ncbi:MAG: ferritin-like domain-containing protein [Candidatus Heimdallarchaeota archaeon]|nr:ferritin-like domain-containing protein [Candidatus Heimdallarchaeota archaeon]